MNFIVCLYACVVFGVYSFGVWVFYKKKKKILFVQKSLPNFLMKLLLVTKFYKKIFIKAYSKLQNIFFFFRNILLYFFKMYNICFSVNAKNLYILNDFTFLKCKIVLFTKTMFYFSDKIITVLCFIYFERLYILHNSNYIQ